jgi:cell division protein FtsL
MDMKQKDFTKKLFYEILIVLFMVVLLLLIFNNF